MGTEGRSEEVGRGRNENVEMGVWCYKAGRNKE